MKNKEYEIWRSFIQKEMNGKNNKEITLTNKQLFEELEAISTVENAEEEIKERFYKQLEFGTGGLRGLLGVGTNRVNIYTIGKVTQGLANYINQGEYMKDSLIPTRHLTQKPSVAIAYDNRNNSKLFADVAASIFIANDIDVYQYKELMPTPALSFAVRHFDCAMGIVITASHNPAKYNGYKVYDNTGCQVTLEAAEKIFTLIESLDIFSDVKKQGGQGKLTYIEEDTEEAYLDAVQRESALKDEAGLEALKKLCIVFTPLNGAGNKCVRKILNRIGITNVHVVKKQEMPDGDFTTCPYPNPEKKEALELGLELCDKLTKEAIAEGNSYNIPDLLLATDPDCDRVGIAVCCNKNSSPEYKLITGNELGVILLDFIICMKVKMGMKKNPIAVKTIVSTKMADAVAAKNGVKMVSTLTGFKFIGEQIALLEKEKREEEYIFGFEESYGYLSGTYVRDKDAVNAAMLICEMAAYYKSKGMTLDDRLEQLYEEYGYYKNELIEFNFEGAKGMEDMQAIMSSFRTNLPEEVTNKKVTEIVDYQAQTRRYLKGAGCCSMVAGTRPTGLPKSEVIEVCLEGNSSFTIRPSGTEPKLKVYISVKGKSKEASVKLIEELKAGLIKIIETTKRRK